MADDSTGAVDSRHSGYPLENRVGHSSASHPPDHPATNETSNGQSIRAYQKLMSCSFSFFVSGLNDGVLGPLVPYILASFDLTTGQMSFMYLCIFLGWVTALPVNPFLGKHLTLGQILSMGALCQIFAQIMRPWGPFPLYTVSYLLCAFGMALQDSYSNNFVSGIALAHRWLGFIHASYAAGLVAAPLIATSIASKGSSIGGVEAWRSTYYVLIGVDVINFASVFVAFRDSIWKPAGYANRESRGKGKLAFEELKESVSHRPLWLLSISFFLQLGAIMTAGGWVVEYLTTVRGGNLSRMGYVPIGMNLGTLLGRLVLAEPIHRLGEKRAILLSFALIISFQLVFWLVPHIISSAVALSLMGFFAGPFIPVGVNVASKIFPRKIRSVALGLIFVLAQAGGALFPSLTGLVAQKAGVKVLQPIILSTFILASLFWWLVPKSPKPANNT